MLWVKSLHIIFMVTWFAGLFYLPRLFVYHALASDAPSLERFKVMERRLYWGIMTPGAVLTIAFGVWLWLGWFRGEEGATPRWLLAKIALVALLAGYHLWCGMLLRGVVPPDIPLHLAVLAGYAIASFYIALVLTRRRLLK